MTTLNVQTGGSAASATFISEVVTPDASFPVGTRVMVGNTSWPVRGAISWGYKSGTDPQQLVIESRPSAIGQILGEQGNGGAVTLAYIVPTSEGLIENEFQRLALLSEQAVDSAHNSVILSDDRWWWARRNVTRAYNIVRKSSDKFVFAPGVVSRTAGRVLRENVQGFVNPAIRPLVTDMPRYFAPWSVDPANGPYTAIDIVLDVLKNFLGYAPQFIDATAAVRSKYVPTNIVIVGESANSVIQRFLSESNNDLYVDETGKIVIYPNAVPFTDAAFKTWIGSSLEKATAGAVKVQDRRATRPSKIRCTFEQEQEILLVFTEGGAMAAQPFVPEQAFSPTAGLSAISKPSPAKTAEEARAQIEARVIALENVTRTVIDNQVGTLARGSIITIEEALGAFGTRFGNAPITLDQYRQIWGAGDMAAAFSVVTGLDAVKTLDPIAVAVWDQIKNDYRKLMRVPAVIAERFKDLQALMVSVLNVESGLRAPSEVYSAMSWLQNLTVRTVLKVQRQTGVVLDSYASQPHIPTSALATVEDINLGLIRLHPLTDINHPGAAVDCFFGRAVDERYYADSFAEGETIINSGTAGLLGAHGLAVPWEIDIVMSAIFLTPNGPSRLKTFEFTADEKALGISNGVTVETHLASDTARYRLPDALVAFNSPSADKQFVNEKILETVARQEAQRIWDTHVDQVYGDVVFAMSGSAIKLRPVGPIRNIVHTITPGGAGRIAFSARPITDGPRIQNKLPENVLKALYRQISWSSAPQGSRQS